MKLRHVVTVIVAASLGLAPAAAAANPMRPSQIANEVTRYYERTFNDGFPIRLHTQTTTAHALRETGYCEPHSLTDPNIMLAELNRQYGTAVDCLVTPEGQHTRDYHRVSKSEAKTINFAPVLNRAGNEAAASAGLTDRQHGAPTRIQVTMQPGKHFAEADVYYDRGTGPQRQLKELKLRVVSGRETVGMVWY
jgi:hypothetical protein